MSSIRKLIDYPSYYPISFRAPIKSLRRNTEDAGRA